MDSAAARTTYAAWRRFFATRDTDLLKRQRATAAVFDRYVCVHFSRALDDELEARRKQKQKKLRRRNVAPRSPSPSLLWV